MKRGQRLSAVLVMIALPALGDMGDDPRSKAGGETGSDVVVTATRGSTEARRVPANVSVITAKDIERSGYDNIMDVIKGVGGIYVRTTSGNTSQAEVGMRGFGENSHGRVLVLLDGRKLNRPDMAGISWLQIPLSNVERIEIAPGANVALYGDHAVAGVINIITKKGLAKPEVSVAASVGSFSTDTERIGIRGSSGDVSYSINASHHETSGYRDRSGYSAWSIGGSLDCEPTEWIMASAALSYNIVSYELPGGLTKEEMEADRRQSVCPDDSADDAYLNAHVTLNASLGDMGRVDMGVVFDRKDISGELTTWSSIYDLSIDTIGISPKYLLESKLLGRDNRFRIGVDYYADKLSVTRFTDITRASETSAAHIEKTTLGVYASDDISLRDTLVLGLGGRIETADITGEMPGVFDDAKTHNANAVDVSLTHLLGQHSKVFARFSTLYRYPFLDEQVVYAGYGGDQMYSDIEAETGDSIGLGTQLRLKRGLDFGATLFFMNMKDEIAYNNVTWRNENLDETRHAGIEAGLTYAINDDCLVELNYTYTDATFTEGANDGKHIPLTPDHTAALGLNTSLSSEVALNTRVRYVDGAYLGGDYANDGAMLSSYVVVDLSLRYSPAAVAGLEAYVAVDNVFDAEYATAGYWGQYHPSPERSFRAGASYRF